MNVALSYLLMLLILIGQGKIVERVFSFHFRHALRPTETKGFLLIFSLHSEFGSLVVANEPLI